ncbi:MAG TPA: HAD family hydrolase [Gemmatimonadaceae bacterium]
MVDAALLELEGVVFDTRVVRAESLTDALRAHGLDALPAHDVTLRDLVTLRAERAFSSRLATSGAALRDGAREFIDSAASQVRLVAVTRASRDDSHTMLRLAGLADRFAMLICAEDVFDGKPSPEGYRLAMERLNRRRPTKPETVLALEADIAGIRAARAAKVRCVAIGPIEAHLAMEADALVESLVGQTIQTLDELSQPGQERVQ